MKHYKKFSVALLLVLGVFGTSTAFAHAQIVSTTPTVSSASVVTTPILPPASSNPVCFVFSKNLYYGENDTTSWSGVTQLQDFLAQKGYFNSAYLGTGHFGPLTVKAVQRYQAANGIPATGFVGTLTRAEINNHCNGMTLGGSETTSTSTSLNAPTIMSLSTTSAAVGDQVSVYGENFGSSNTVLLRGDSGVGTQDISPVVVPSAMDCTNILCNGANGGRQEEMLTFTIPQVLTPVCPAGTACPMFALLVTGGSYTVSVQDASGTSNTLPLTITGGGTPSTATATST